MSALIGVETAQVRLLALKQSLSSETISLNQIVERYTSHDVVADRDQPAAPLSAMDGYAIRFADLPGPWTVVGESSAGSPPGRGIDASQAMRIFTGAIVPTGADAVLVQEDARRDGGTVTLTGDGPSACGTNIRIRAGDFAKGDVLLPAGARMTAGAIAAAAMTGAGTLAVGKRPRVAIVTTGDELVAPGDPLGPGQIPDSNGIMIAAQLASTPAIVSPPVHVRDDRRILSNMLRELSRHHDVIVTVGGASVGDHDHVHGAITDAGGAIEFWKIAMRPGKPLIAAMLGDAIILGLPGNPSSAFVTATLFLLPLVRHLAGAIDPLPAISQAPLALPLVAGGSRRDYLRATIRAGKLYPLVSQDSGQTRPLALADALVIREIDADARDVGAVVDYIAI